MGPSVLLRARGLDSPVPVQLLRATACGRRAEGGGRCWTRREDTEEIIERVAALDIGKAELVACVRVPDPDRPGRRVQEIAHVLDDDPLAAGAGRSAARAGRDPGGDGGDLGLLEAGVLPAGGGRVWTRGWSTPATSSTCPGGRRPTGSTRCGCAKVAERQMLRPSFVPPPPIRLLRDLTRYRVDLVSRAHRGEEPGGEAARGRPDQAVRGGLGHLRGVRAGDDGRAAGRRTRPGGAGAAGPGPDAAARSRCWRRRSSGTSPIITRSCCAPCWPASMRPAPTSPPSRPGSRS